MQVAGRHLARLAVALHVVGQLLAYDEFAQARNLSVGEGYGAAKWWRRNVIKAAERGAEKGNTIRLSASGRELDQKKVRRDFLAAAAAAVEAGAEPADYRDFR